MGKRAKPEEIIVKLRAVEVRMNQGETIAQAVRSIGVTEQTFYRWRKEYGGLRVGQAKRMKEMEKENARLRRAVSDLTLDNQILQEVVRGKLFGLQSLIAIAARPHPLHANALRSIMWWISSVFPYAEPAVWLASIARPRGNHVFGVRMKML